MVSAGRPQGAEPRSALVTAEVVSRGAMTAGACRAVVPAALVHHLAGKACVFAGADILLTVLSKPQLLVLGEFVCEAEGN